MAPTWRTLLLICAAPGIARAQSPAIDGRAGIEAFNRALETATRAMDNAATLALWEDDGVSLLPATKPIVGKKAIAQFMADVTKQIVGGRMATFYLRCFGIEVSGPLGSEWCLEHQIVEFSDGKPPFDGWGKMLFVLHRGSDGNWRLRSEMWNMGSAGDATDR